MSAEGLYTYLKDALRFLEVGWADMAEVEVGLRGHFIVFRHAGREVCVRMEEISHDL